MATMRVMSEVEGQRFTGFPPGALTFLKRLKRNNDREWFAKRKAEYEETLLGPMLLLVRELGERLHAEGLPLAASAKSPVHRIYRDIRFSNDKTPFQTHLGSALYRDGDKHKEGMLYLHVDPEHSFVAAGSWMPEKANLRRWRDHIATDPGPLLRLAKTMPLEEQDTLKRMPRGYEQYADAKAAPLLRLKSFLVRQELDVAQLESRAVVERVVGFAQGASPLLRFGWGLEEGSSNSPVA